VAGLIKELNKMLEIEMKLLIAFHPQINKQTNRQTKRTNQELE